VCRSLESPCAVVAARESATRDESKEIRMATRILSKALVTAALGIALSPLLAATTAPSSASSGTAVALQLDPPAAPSHVQVRTTRVPDPEWPHGYYVISIASWTDNSSNEDGFIVETWYKQSGTWVLMGTSVTPANSTTAFVDGSGQGYRFRAKAFNAAGESAWSNWGR
jgi:hypothetical protein